MTKIVPKFKYFVRYYNEDGNRFERGPFYSSEKAAVIARSKLYAKWLRVSIRCEMEMP